jgi:DNA-binding HxlR family transcriptional regulator
MERHAQAPRRVEYSLTDLGRTLVEPIEVLNSWARAYGGVSERHLVSVIAGA